MKKQITLKKTVVALFISMISVVTSAQNSSSQQNDIKGSFTVYVNSPKNLDFDLTEDHKSQIESKRQDNKDVTTKIDGYDVRIMSREKMGLEIKWPKYAITND